MTQKNNSKLSALMALFSCLACAYCIAFPADVLNIKEILFTIPVALYFLFVSESVIVPRYIFAYGIIYPILTIVYSCIRGNEVSSVISYGYEWFILLLVLVTVACRVDLKKIFFAATYFIALIIDVVFIFDFLGIIPLGSNPISVFFSNMNEFQGLGKGIFSTFGYSIYYRSCALVLVTYSYLLYKRNYVLCVPIVLSMLVCGSRANFLMAAFISAAVPLLCTKKPSKKVIVVVLLTVVAFAFLPALLEKMMALNDLKFERSESIKITDAKVIFSNANSNFLNLLLGTGVGSSFYSPRGVEMKTTELSYIDYFRQAGIFGIIILAAFLIKPVKWLFNNERWLLIGYVCYLIVAGTNPLLVTSTSFMLYVLVYHEYEMGRRISMERKKYEDEIVKSKCVFKRNKTNLFHSVSVYYIPICFENSWK